MKTKSRWLGLLWSLVLSTFLLASQAEAALLDVGPVVPQVINSSPPQHGFPLWYRDTNRLPLELCLGRTASVDGPMCLTAEPNPAAPLNFPNNFGDEVFWWSADAIIDLPGGGRAILVLAIEAAFALGSPIPGDQISFARVRIRIDTPVAGQYVITHPYGQQTLTVDPGAEVDGINFTMDIGVAEGGSFTGAVNGEVGPFLYWDTGPIDILGESFVGNPNVAHKVLGSTFPDPKNPGSFANLFRVEGPALFGTVETDLFSVMGKIYKDPIPTPLKVDSAVYTRTAAGMEVDVFAATQPLANTTTSGAPFPGNFALAGTPSNLQLSGTGIPTRTMTTNNPADGSFFSASGVFAAPEALPATIRVTNTADIPPTIVDVPLVDEVAISEASYTTATSTLRIVASSGDNVAPPTLQAFMPGEPLPLGTLTGGELSVTFPIVRGAKTYNIPPESVTVTSSAGGSDSAPVNAPVLPTPPPPATGVTLAAFPVSPQTAGTGVAFVATGAGGSGAYEHQFWLHDGTAWSMARDFSANGTWIWNTTGLAANVYTIQVNTRSAGSSAPFEAVAALAYTLNAVAAPPAPATGATLAASPASPQPSGTSVIFTAAGVGGSGAYEFEFWRHDGVSWTKVQSYSPVNSWVWYSTGAAAGTYSIQVNVRSAGSTAAFEGVATIGYTLSPAVAPPAPATGATITATPASPKPAGTQFVVFSAAGVGGSGTYEFEFWLHNGVSWSKVQAYSPIANFAWDTTGLAAGIYTFQVNVRSAGSTAAFEAFGNTSYEIP